MCVVCWSNINTKHSVQDKKRSRRMCGECVACLRTEDCAQCDFCKVSFSLISASPLHYLDLNQNWKRISSPFPKSLLIMHFHIIHSYLYAVACLCILACTLHGNWFCLHAALHPALPIKLCKLFLSRGSPMLISLVVSFGLPRHNCL